MVEKVTHFYDSFPPPLSLCVQDRASVGCGGRSLRAVQRSERRAGEAHLEVRHSGGVCGRNERRRGDSAARAEAPPLRWPEGPAAGADEGAHQGDKARLRTDRSEEEEEAPEALGLKSVASLLSCQVKLVA